MVGTVEEALQTGSELTTVLAARYTSRHLLDVIRIGSARKGIFVARAVRIAAAAPVRVGFAASFCATLILGGCRWVVELETDFVVGAVGAPTHVRANRGGHRAVEHHFGSVCLSIRVGNKKWKGKSRSEEVGVQRLHGEVLRLVCLTGRIWRIDVVYLKETVF